MSIFLGNVQFKQVESMLGYRLTEKDREVWDRYHSQNANLSASDKESCFHIYDIPRCIRFKGDLAKEAITAMFTPEKIVKPMGEFQVYEVKQVILRKI